jgi:EAL domain-containing protein (putative c-di-GMP-specific phosphodiesterase class I)/predicted benzoate:H+ symporter BenE
MRGAFQSQGFVARCAPFLRDANPSAIAAGVTTFIWYAVGMVPVQIAAVGQFGLDSAQVSSWIFIIWASGAVASIALSLLYRQPIPITSTIPGLLFMATLAGSYSYPELVGANLLAGLIMVVLAVCRLGGRLLDLLPMPLAMGMLGGSILADVSRAVTATVNDAVVAGATVAGYLIGRTIRNEKIPPVSLALVAGGIAVLLTRSATPAPLAWHLPTLVVPSIELSFSSFVAVSLPMVVLSMGLGNIQGLGFLRGQGYPVPVNVVTFVLGLNSVVNACFGGHAAIVSRNGMPIMASSEAGPVGGRYWANLISAALTLIIAFAAYPVASLFAMLPMSYVIALAGVAILPSFQNAVEMAFTGKMRFGAVVAFIIACTPFSLLGISSAFWALIGGMAASLIVERTDLLGHWRRTEAPEQRREPRLPVQVQPSAAYRVHGRRRTPLLTRVRDLSDHGLSIQSEQQLFPGDQLELTFNVPDAGIDVSIRVDVRHVTHLVDDPVERWEAGCELHAVSPAAREHLAALLVHHESEGAEKPRPPASTERRSGPVLLHQPSGLDRPSTAAAAAPFDIGADLIRAINREELLVYYQPVISFETHRVVEVEALIRWKHPERGMVEPSRFLPIAESTGLITLIGHRVLEQACRDVRTWQSEIADTEKLGLAINVSARQLQDPNLVEDIAQTLWHTRLDTSCLSVELTEASVLEDPEAAADTLHRLRRLGIRVVLDDFGTGPSSLRRLSQLPIDALKIDTSLTCGLDADGSQANLVKSIIGVAQSLGMEVTAEGVESWGQQTLLRRMGCQRGQGYFFARPQPGEQIPDMLGLSMPALLGPAAAAIPA